MLGWFGAARNRVAVDAGEVARVAVVPVAELADPANRFRVVHPSGWHGPGFAAAGLFVWGFTALLLDRLLEIGGWARAVGRHGVPPAAPAAGEPAAATPLSDRRGCGSPPVPSVP